MKVQSIFLILIFATVINVQAQLGTILGLSVYPSNPNTNDNVKIICNSSFSSGGCQLTNYYFNINETNIIINAIHTVGPLAYICSTTDTINIGMLNNGTYQLIYNLINNYNQIILHTDTLLFTVQQTSGINDLQKENIVIVYPNPFNNKTTFSINKNIIVKDAELYIFDAYQRQIKHIEIINNNDFIINKGSLANGIYFYKLMNNQKQIKTGKLVIN